MTEEIYLSLGSNLGDRAANLAEARHLLADFCHEMESSALYITQPWGYADQPVFLNQVLKSQTELAPHLLLRALKKIETGMGRLPNFRYGPRLIDIDILFYGSTVLQLPDLCIPHRHLAERAFVLVPLFELAPDLINPANGQTVRQMLAAVDTSGILPFSED